MPHMDHALRDLTDHIHAARADRTALQICGGSSKAFQGTATGEVLDTRSLQGVISYEPTELVVTVAAGTPWFCRDSGVWPKEVGFPVR